MFDMVQQIQHGMAWHIANVVVSPISSRIFRFCRNSTLATKGIFAHRIASRFIQRVIVNVRQVEDSKGANFAVILKATIHQCTIDILYLGKNQLIVVVSEVAIVTYTHLIIFPNFLFFLGKRWKWDDPFFCIRIDAFLCLEINCTHSLWCQVTLIVYNIQNRVL